METAFDAFKNTLEADRTYMQNDQALEGWMFINYLALLAYWRILKLLVKNNCGACKRDRRHDIAKAML